MTRALSQRFNQTDNNDKNKNKNDKENNNINKLNIIESLKEEYKLVLFIILILLLLVSLYIYRKYTGGFEIKQNNLNNKINKKFANNNMVAINSGNNSGDGSI
jgi:hypothetical protein